MEVILMKDQRSLGKRGQVVKVKPGFARNYLLPEGLALAATPANQKIFEHKKKKIEVEHAKERDAAQAVADQIKGTHIVLTKRSTDGTHLYGSVTVAEIHEELGKKGVTIDRRRIDLEGGIKSVGDHHVRLELHPEVSVEVLVTINAQE